LAFIPKVKPPQALSLGETALRLDSRYANLDYLKENLWGDRLINDTQKFLANPQIQKVLIQVKDTQPTPPSP
jgi:hypothetical protein